MLHSSHPHLSACFSHQHLTWPWLACILQEARERHARSLAYHQEQLAVLTQQAMALQEQVAALQVGEAA